MKYLLIITLATLILFSCKKKTAAPATGGPVTTTGGIINNSSTYGSMSTFLMQSYYGQVFGGIDSSSTATFYTGLSSSNPVYVSAGTVKLNNTAFKYDSNHYYQDTTHAINVHGACTWNISGSADVPAITYSYTPVYPVFTGNSQLPDSISIASGCTVNIAGATNIANTSVVVEFYQGSNYVTKQIPPNQTSCHFSVGELSALQSGTDATLLIVFSSSNIQVFGGKQYSFESTLDHLKYNVRIKP